MTNDLLDKIKGVIYGQAIGDALGLATEFLSKMEVGQYYPMGFRDYDQIVRDMHRKRWERGRWTDDTDQMLCIMDSLLEKEAVDILDIARRIKQWYDDGGMGIGFTVPGAIEDPDFLREPRKVARKIWEKSEGRSASNGGVMRTSILGVWEYSHLEKVKENAAKVCEITHHDPRCVGSCVAVSMAISLMLQGESHLESLHNAVLEEVKGYHIEMEEYLKAAKDSSIAFFDLDHGMNRGEENQVGYTLKTLGSAFWSLMNGASFEAGIIPVVEEGGDADTNAAVAGALLGARFGFSNIPSRWVEGLIGREELESRVVRLIELVMGGS